MPSSGRESDGPERRQGADRRTVRAVAAWASGWAAALLLAAWTGRPEPGWLAGAAVAVAAWALLGRGVGRAWRWGVAAALAGAVVVAAGAQLRLREVARGWPEMRAAVEATSEAHLRDGLDRIFDRGEAAAEEAGAAFRARRGAPLFVRLAEIRRASGVSALAVYDTAGRPVAWAGEHRGGVPDAVRLGERFYSFSSGPLYGYVHFARPLEGGGTAVAAVLLEAHLAAGTDERPFAERFAERYGVEPRFTTPSRASGEAVWDWSSGETPILSVSLAALTQERWMARVSALGRRAAAVALALALAVLTAAWFAVRAGPAGVPVAAWTAAALLLPLEALGAPEPLFSPLSFVLPGPVALTLGGLLLLLAGASAWALTRGGRRRRMDVVPLALRLALVAAVPPAAVALVRAGASEGRLAEQPAGGTTLVLALVLLVALPTLLLAGGSPPPVPSRRRGLLLAGSVVAAGVLGVAAAGAWAPERPLPLWSAAPWGVLLAAAVVATPRGPGSRGTLLRWTALGWIAGTAALPHLWAAHLDARLDGAEREIARLGTHPDPFLNFLLREFAESVLFYAAEGREGVGLLFQAWTESGLAREGYEGRVTLWEEGTPRAELRLGGGAIPPEMVPEVLAAARTADEPRVERRTDLDALYYLLTVPLSGGRTATVAVPPRRHVGSPAGLARVLDPGAGAERPDGSARLSLVPVAEAGAPAADSVLRWVRVDGGWRSEALAEFPEGPRHAHLLVPTPSRPILLVRGLLVQALVLAVVVGLWALARTLCGEPLGVPAGRWRWAWSFRGRLTLALLLFFLLPTALFGTIAYRSLSEETVRTAGALAGRALEQAALELRGATLPELATHVGADLLRYEDGVLADAAFPEVLELGVHPTWLPPALFLDFAAGEEGATAEQERSIGGHDYLIAYRRVDADEVIASPTPLATGDVARRQRELTSIVLLAVLLGATLSVVLALVVGRALSDPIARLSRAAARVGGGDLSVRLDGAKRDEFGRLFHSFNRMVDGLGEAQEALLRETRRTEAIVAGAGTGVLALDAAGRVALVNPRACDLLGRDVAAGEPLPENGPVQRAVAAALDAFLASGEREDTEEVELDDRVLRLRLRRLGGDGETRGAVLVLEDVTQELRTARVLAWGEMARQVAHEIKNPLTPIKLAVQHVRRARADRRADFDDILDRNVEAVLREIDRLGEIARAFARFGTPADAALPPEPIDAGRVAEETLALYRGGRDGIGYRLETEAGAPAAYARAGELKEVLVNLLENARAALDGGGEVEIRTGTAGGGEWIRIDVSDTGEGMPPDVLARAFEPQFSTRSSGTGLGLAIVRRLVESWGGEVTIDSRPGEGTVVHLRLRAAGDGTQG